MDQAFYEKVAGAVVAACTVAFTPFLWRKFRAWWRQPSERKMLAEAIVQNTSEIHGIRTELRGIGANFQTLSEQAMIATSISRMALNDSATPRWETDENGQCVWVSNSLAKLFGMQQHDMLGSGWTRAIVPGHQPEVARAFREAYSSPDEYAYVHPYAIQVEGKLVNVIARSVEVVRKSDGKILRMFGTVKPVETHHDLKLQETAA
jgi:PAS domain S-box-containing protein